MAEKTGIAWTDHTFNPWWGCVKVSDGCTNCYAMDQAKRFGHDIWGPASTTARRTFGGKHWSEPVRWNNVAAAEGRRHRVFCASMADVFEDHPMLESEREKLWSLIDDTPWLNWQILTKRPENISRMLPWRSPRPNLWLGTSVENQAVAEARIEALFSAPAYIRFLSCEPLLGPVNLSPFIYARLVDVDSGESRLCSVTRGRLSWVIVGGESGPKHRPMNLDWARSLRDQCAEAGIPMFFKQVGGRTHDAGGHLLDGKEYHEFPAEVAHA